MEFTGCQWGMNAWPRLLPTLSAINSSTPWIVRSNRFQRLNWVREQREVLKPNVKSQPEPAECRQRINVAQQECPLVTKLNNKIINQPRMPAKNNSLFWRIRSHNNNITSKVDESNNNKKVRITVIPPTQIVVTDNITTGISSTRQWGRPSEQTYFSR
jgi:hypothetical protein